jgi:hypothetical protein
LRETEVMRVRTLVRSRLKLLVPVAFLAWATATAFLASEHGAERRLAFNGAVRR